MVPTGAPSSCEFTRGLPWDKGITEELRLAFLPPHQYMSSLPFAPVDEAEVHRVVNHLCKAVGVSHAYLQLKGEYVKSAGEVQRLNVDLEIAREKAKRLAEERRQAEAAKEQAEETSCQAVEELKRSTTAVGKVTEELLLTKAALDQSNYEVAKLQSTHSLSMDAVKTVMQQRCNLVRELEETRGALEEQKTAYQKAVAAVKKTAEQCFKASLAQIQLLNPGTELNLANYDYHSFIKDGVLVPPTPSPEVSLADDDQGREVGEEVSSAVEPEEDVAHVEEAAPPS
ncbi:hypothetical protein K1719_003920 [Acacia pycnantha]|nr:hypothetical protein K1719_003920 [Acacia pycnantha]